LIKITHISKLGCLSAQINWGVQRIGIVGSWSLLGTLDSV